jgi:biofilm protein TabA
MIFDKIANWEKYSSVHPLFKTAFEYLLSNDLAILPKGKYEIIGKDLYVAISHEVPIIKESYPHEAHKNYIDIQVSLKGEFEAGHKFIGGCKNQTKEYNPEKDVEFYGDAPDSKVLISEGEFAIFFPEDAHIPYPPKEKVDKAVFKVKVK